MIRVPSMPHQKIHRIFLSIPTSWDWMPARSYKKSGFLIIRHPDHSIDSSYNHEDERRTRMKTIDEIKALDCIGHLRNNWRQRDCWVYKHEDPKKVYSIGYPFNGGKPVVCEEDIQGWDRTIGIFPGTAIYD